MDIGAEATIEPIFISVKQAAEALNISPASCWELLSDKEIASAMFGRRRLVSVESLRAYADRLLQESA